MRILFLYILIDHQVFNDIENVYFLRRISLNRKYLITDRLVHPNNNNDSKLITPKVKNNPAIDSIVIALNFIDEREQEFVSNHFFLKISSSPDSLNDKILTSNN